jgi:hypothetical protein
MKRTGVIILLVAFVSLTVVCPQQVYAGGTLINETVGVDALGLRAYYGTVSSGDIVTVDITVTQGDISFYIMDQSNYDLLTDGGNASAYVIKYDVVDTTFTWTVPSTKMYYFVLDNRDSLTSATVQLVVTYQEPGEIVSNAIPAAVLGGIAVTIIVVVGIAVGVAYSTRHKKTEPSPPFTTKATARAPETESAPEAVRPRFCSHCAAPIPSGAEYCSSCGARIRKE